MEEKYCHQDIVESLDLKDGARAFSTNCLKIEIKRRQELVGVVGKFIFRNKTYYQSINNYFIALLIANILFHSLLRSLKLQFTLYQIQMQPEQSQKKTYDGLGAFIKVMTVAIAQQREAEIEQFRKTIQENTTKDLELMGLVVNTLRVRSTKTGLYGRTLLTLTRPAYSKALVESQKNLDKIKIPDCRFGVGDNVSIYDQCEYIKGKPLIEGVLHSKLEFKLTISIDENDDSKDVDLEDKNLCICSATNEVTYGRYVRILKELGEVGHDSSHFSTKIIRTLFDYVKFSAEGPPKDLDFEDSTLNVDQKTAIMNGLASQSVHLIHGPPGTGKTKTICELIVQAVKRGQRVLACAGSNVAVDNIVERICKNKAVHPCRIGHPSRMLPAVYEYCLDSLVSKTSSQKILKELKHKFQQLKLKYIKAPRKNLKEQMTGIRQQIRNQQEVAIKEVLHEANVICCTNAGASDRVFHRQLNKIRFDLVVIDECAQAVEVSCWIPILKGCRLVLAGDHLQLPPTIKSKNSQALAYTLFDRAMKECPVTSNLLSIQYRMNEAIMEWSSKQFYDGKLVADETVKNHDIKGISKTLKEVKAPLMFIDTAGSKLGENLDKGDSDLTKSKYNIGEADLVKIVYEELKNHGLKGEQIGIITPYNAQVNFIKQLLEGEPVEISTVDGFQGREKQCIVISMVRSNPQKIVGFLADKRRMNVAVTRARRFVCLIGDSETVCNDPVLKTLIEYFQSHGELRNAADFQDDERVRFGLGYVDKNQITKEPKPEKTSQKPKKKKENKEKIRPGDEIVQTNETQLNQLLNEIIGHDEQNKPIMPTLVSVRQTEDKFERIIEGFLLTQDKFLNFDHLTAYQRRCVHKVAEDLGLNHQTSVDKNTMTLTRKDADQDQPGARTEEVIKQKQAQMEKFKENTRAKIEDLVKSDKNSIEIRNLNGDERAVVKELVKEMKLFYDVSKNKKVVTVCKDLQKLNAEKVDRQQVKKDDKKKKEKIKEDKSKEQEEKLLEYLDKMNEKALKKQCNYPHSECTAKIEYLGMTCNYCKLLYCTQHVLAEIHGCEDQARRQARDKFKKQYEQKSGNKASEEMREELKKRIAKLEQKRQVHAKKGSKK